MKCLVCQTEYDDHIHGNCPVCNFPAVYIVGGLEEEANQDIAIMIKEYKEEYLKSIEKPKETAPQNVFKMEAELPPPLPISTFATNRKIAYKPLEVEKPVSRGKLKGTALKGSNEAMVLQKPKPKENGFYAPGDL